MNVKMTKVLSGKNYGSIPHMPGSRLGKHDMYLHEGQAQIIKNGGRDKHDLVIVSLKLDGTNVGVLKQKGRLIALQRKGYDCRTSPYATHHAFADYVEANYAHFDVLLDEGDRIAGEWLWEASGIHYRIQGQPFVPFDVFKGPPVQSSRAPAKRLPWTMLVQHLEFNGLFFQQPPYVTYGFRHSGRDTLLHNDLDGYRIQTIDRQAHEGYVYRVERKGEFDFAAKWVRSDYVPGRYLPGIGLPEAAAPVPNLILNP